MNIVVVTPYPPVLHLHGGGVRMFHNIRLLAREHSVRVFSFVEDDGEAQLLDPVRAVCESVTAIQRISDLGAHWFSLVPFLVREFGTPAMHHAVDEAVRTTKVDLIQCEYLQMAQYRRPGIPSILTIHEIYAVNAFRAFETAPTAKSKLQMFSRWMTMMNYEISMCNSFDRVVAMTDADAAYLRSYARRADIRAIPIGIDAESYKPDAMGSAERPPHVVFVGNYRHPPNLEAAEFLLTEVAPFFPGVEFTIAGLHLPPGLPAPANVRFPGYVSDTRDLFHSPNTIFCAPVFSGTGQRVKLLEAFAMEAAVVTTPLGAAGFPIVDREHALIASDGEGFRAAVRELISSATLRCRLGRQARRIILEHFTWDKIGRQFSDLAAECAAGR